MIGMSLAGLRVAVTGSRRASELAALISNLGGTSYLAPTVGIQSIEQIDPETTETMKRIISGEVDHAVFMTGPGTYALIDWAEKLGLKQQLIDALNRIHIVARSHKPASALNAHDIHVDMVPDDNTSEGIVREMRKLDLEGRTVAVLWYGASKPVLRKELEACGAKIREAMVYNYSLDLGAGGEKILTKMGFKPVPPDEEKVLDLIGEIRKRRIHAITFTSPPSARNLFQIASQHNLEAQLTEDLNQNVIVVTVGPPTKEEIEAKEVRVDVIPEIYKLGPMMKALEDYVKTGKGKAASILQKIRYPA